MKKPFVSIIIPNLNNQERLDLCLSALMDQTYASDQREILLVDNGSIDRSVEIAKKYQIQVLSKTEFKSPYWCRNAGIKAAKGEIIALLDSNCIPVNTWLEAGITYLQTNPASIVTGPVNFQFSQPPALAERVDYLYSVFHANDIPERIALPATHLFIRKSLFNDIGLFIPHIRSLGDIEWTSRAKTNGYSFGFVDQAKVNYPAKDFAKAVKKMIRLGGGTKELWVAQGKSLGHWRWPLKVLKNLFPPSPGFYQYMSKKNKKENTKIPPLVLYLSLYLIKLCYAWGMLFKKVARPINDDLE